MSTSVNIPSGAAVELLGSAPLIYDRGYIHTAVKARCTAHTGLRALVGSRVYLGNLPQLPVYPAIVFNEIFGSDLHDMEGKGDLGFTQFQFDIVGPSFNYLPRIAEQLRLCWLGFDGTVTGVRVWGARFISRGQGQYEPDAELQRYMVEIELWHDNTSA